MRNEPTNSQTPTQRHSLAVFAALAASVFSGCKTTNGTAEVGHYEVSVSSTPMFRYGPAQSFGADFSLAQGTHVVMLKREFGYSRVMTDEGQTGYVATEDIKPAPPPSTAANPGVDPSHLRFLSPGRGARSGVSAANTQAVIQTGPLFGGDDLPPLPEKDPLQPGNVPPGFRVNVPQRKANEPAPPPKPKAEMPKTEEGKPGFRVNVPTR